MKLIFVTGGVISGLGKGITAASIGKLLSSAGYSVTMVKADPYLNVDAGTMSPYEHGEVFVADDGAETDLDLGHYERFINTSMGKRNSITSGKIYQKVLDNERKGLYLGDDIQVIPHVVNEVKKSILDIAHETDITIVEIGGTIGDIEGPHFTEAARQLKKDIGKENILYVHVVPVLYLTFSGEFKTKPIQHSHKELTRLGIQADMLICRTEHPLQKGIKEKISLFCDIDPERVIENPNCKTIYELPGVFFNQKVHELIQQKLELPYKPPHLDLRQQQVDRLLSAEKIVTVGMVGKYAKIQDSYISVVEALKHAGAYHHVRICIERIHAEDFEDVDKHQAILEKVDGLVIPGGFGIRGMEGKIMASKLAREKHVPYLGLCLGLQMAVIDFARHVCNLPHAHTLEAESDCETPVISYMPGQSETIEKGASMRLGAYITKLVPGSKVESLYQRYVPQDIKDATISERHRHRFEVNPDYYELLEQNGMHLSGRDTKTNLVEFIELPNHPYFVATQAHPEFKSKLDKPHPLFAGFVEACMGEKKVSK